MNGCWIPNTPIAVDFWRTLKCPAKIFFLSHMHADHTSGLSSSWKDKIYCSEISAKLLKAKFDIRDELIQPLTTDVSHIVELDALNSITMTVTLIDAHHCPGAVMYLFEGYFGTILYTGDFRFCEDMLPDLDVLNGKSIDTLYFDNTYNSPEFLFPPREDAKKVIMQTIDDHKDDAVIVIGMFTLGKEDLLVDIAKYFRTWIVVSPDKMKQVKLLDLPDVFTTDINAGWIWVERKMKITSNNVAKWNEEQATVALLPTGLHSTSYRNSSNIHVVPYSDHSSYPELLRFVAHIKPRRLIPIVRKGGDSYAKNSITDLDNFDPLLDKTPHSTLIIPKVFQMNSFNSFNKVMMMQKTVNSRVKRKHSAGVQFFDSPDEEKTPKQPKLDENLNEENVYVGMTTDECIDYEKGMKENMQAGPINVVDNCNALEDDVKVSTGYSIERPQGMDSSKKKPMKHLIEIFAGQSPPLVNGTTVAVKKDTSQLTLSKYFQARDSSPALEESCSISTTKPEVKTVLEVDLCSPKKTDSLGDPITQPFQNEIKSPSTVEESCSIMTTETQVERVLEAEPCSPKKSASDTFSDPITEPFHSEIKSLSTAEESCSILATETQVKRVLEAEPCSLHNSRSTLESSGNLVVQPFHRNHSIKSPSAVGVSIDVLKTGPSCSSSTNSLPSTKNLSGALAVKTCKELREKRMLENKTTREVLDCLEVSTDGEAYFI